MNELQPTERGSDRIPTSEPVIPVQPDALQYGLDAIAIVRQYTREEFEEEWGVQPRAFDPSRDIQTWFDTTALGETQRYRKLTPRGLETFTVVGRERATPNLPGPFRYPRVQYRGTTAYQQFPDGRREAIAPKRLTTEEEASLFVEELDGTGYEEDQHAGFAYIYPIDEPRRVHIINLRPGHSTFAWLLRNLQTTWGVGAPGQWKIGQAGDVDLRIGDIRWIPSPIPDGSNAKSHKPVPVRELLLDETVVRLQSGLAAIRRKDLGPTSDGFNAADREKLDAIYRKLIFDR